MLGEQIDRLAKKIPMLEEFSEAVTASIRDAVEAGGEPARDVADLLHGTWLGHPLHPVLTDVPIGSWVAASLFDMISLAGDERAGYAADRLVGLGVLAALPTVLSGLLDYSVAPDRTRSTITLHALAMDATTTLYLTSLWARARGARGTGIGLAGLGLGLMTLGAYIGGHISLGKQVGVNHALPERTLRDWTPALAADELADGEATRVEVRGNEILLYRYGGTLFAIGARCSHAGMRLDKGHFDGFCVHCPWHHSVFDMRDGSVVHGPATYPQPEYDTRVNDGMIEVRSVPHDG